MSIHRNSVNGINTILFVCFEFPMQGTWEKKLNDRIGNVYRKRKPADNQDGN